MVGRKEIIIKGTKTHAVRRLALDDFGVEVLRRHRAEASSRASDLGKQLTESDWIFTYDGTNPINPDTVTHYVKAVATRVGVDTPPRAEALRSHADDRRRDRRPHGGRASRAQGRQHDASGLLPCAAGARENGFGYDPIFLPDGHTRGFGEMSAEEKHGIPADGSLALSHRARAFQLLARACLG